MKTSWAYTAVFLLMASSEALAQCGGPDSLLVSQPRCINTPIMFTGLPVSAPTQFTWNFGDGTVLTLPGSTTTAAHAYAAAGTYTVVLLSEYAGCTDTVSSTLTVDAFPTAAFTYIQNGTCGGVPITFQNTSLGATGYLWNFGDTASTEDTSSLQNPQYTFSPTGTGQQTYTVTLTAISANGCSVQTTQTITVAQIPDASLEDASNNNFSGCDVNNLALTVTNASNTAADNVHYHISWGNGSPDYDGATFTSASTVYNSQGMFPITFTVTGSNGCVATQVYNAFNGSNPSIGLSTPGSTIGLCSPITIQFPLSNFENNPPGTTYTILTNDGSPNVVYSHPPPALITHTFSGSSCGYTGLGGSANSFYLRVIASNPCGESIVTVEPIRVSEEPTVNFSAPQAACINVPYVFGSQLVDGTSVSNQGVCNSTLSQLNFRYWEINPATGWTSSSNLQNSATANVTFIQPGTYTVTFIGGTSCGRDTVVKTICVTGPPAPNFIVSTDAACAPFTVGTDNLTPAPICNAPTSIWSITPIQSVCEPVFPQWQFDSATTAQSAEPFFTFHSPGRYRVVLTQTHTCGTVTKADTVTVKAPPTVSLAALSSACGTQTIAPTLTANGCLGQSATAYSWSFPGGTPATSSVLSPGSIVYNTPGTYLVSVSATNECGSTDTSTTFQVYPIPTANAGADVSVCPGDTVSIGTATSGLTYAWSPIQYLTDPNAAQTGVVGNNPSAGTVSQSYILSVADSNCTGTDTVSVTVYPTPTLPTVQGDSICAGEQAQLQAAATGTVLWYTTATGGAPIHSGNTYITPVLYTTQTYYTEHDNGTCTSLSRVPVTAVVHPLPPTQAGPDMILCNQPVGTQLTGTPAGGTWLGTYITASGLFTPADTGTFENTYLFGDANGCSRSDTLYITVVNPTPAIAQNDTTVCAGGQAFTVTALPAGGTWSGGPVSPSGVFNPTLPGTYTLYYQFGNGSCAVQDTVLITVIDQPVVEAGNANNVCGDAAPFILTGNSPGGGIWSGAGIIDDTLGLFNPALVSPGTHVITYTVYGGNGCPASDSKTVTVFALPTVNAGPDVALCNQPIPVQLVATPAGGFWTGGNVSPSGMYTPAGIGTFTLAYTYTNANNCSRTDSLTVTVTEPEYLSTPTLTRLCHNTPTFWMYASIPGGTWAGYNVTSNGWFSPTTVGTFHLVYTVGTGTCQVSDTATVIVHPLPVINAGNDTVVCISAAPFVLTGVPMGGTWDGMGITNPSTGAFSPALAGAGVWPATYMYTDSNTCYQYDYRLIEVLPQPSATFTADTLVCTNAGVSFVANASGSFSYAWNFGDGSTSTLSNPYHTYANEGYFTVQLIVSAGAGCSDTTTQVVHVISFPQADIAATPTSGCGPLAVNVTALNPLPNVTYAWDLGNGSTATSAAPGNVLYAAPVVMDTVYHITLTTTNACGSDQATQDISVFAEPSAMMGTDVNTGCSPLNVQFVQLSTGGVTGVFWNFGDGSTSTSSNPGSHTFVTGSTDTVYTVMLAIQTACGPDTAYTDIHVLPNTVNAFFNTNPLQGCPPLEVDFTNYSTGGTVNEWTFGDNDVSTETSPTHVYETPGTYTAILTVNNGCSFDTAQINIIVYDFPSLNFTAPTAALCQNQSVTFANTSSSVANTSWSFGDGGTSNAYSPTHTYSTAGTFLVSLTGTSVAYGCTGTVSATVTVNPSPVLDIQFPQGQFCAPYTANFINNSQQTDYYTWQFGDGNSAAGANPSHTYWEEGTFIITVIGEHVGGCKDTATGSINILPSPQAAFTVPVTGCVPVSWLVNNQTTGAISYLWDLGNGTTSTLNEPTLNYNVAGNYIITLEASNAYGCTDSVQQNIKLYNNPIAAMGLPVSACAGSPVQFSNLSIHGDGYFWQLGDGNTSTHIQPEYVYNSEGKYDITLVVSNPGCSDTLYIPDFVTIHPVPEAYFTLLPDTITTSNPVIQLLCEQPGGCTYYLPNGETLNQCKAQTRLNDVDLGPQIILLVVTNEFGCQDSAWNSVFVQEGVTLFVPNAYTPNVDGENEIFYAYGTGIKTFEMTIFDRWGNEVFKSNDIQQGWNGKNKTGQTVKQDVYIWKITARDVRDELIKTQGNVTVVY